MSVELILEWVHVAMMAFPFGYFTLVLASIFRNACWFVLFEVEDDRWHVAIGHVLFICFLFTLPTIALVFLLDWALR